VVEKAKQVDVKAGSWVAWTSPGRTSVDGPRQNLMASADRRSPFSLTGDGERFWLQKRDHRTVVFSPKGWDRSARATPGEEEEVTHNRYGLQPEGLERSAPGTARGRKAPHTPTPA